MRASISPGDARRALNAQVQLATHDAGVSAGHHSRVITLDTYAALLANQHGLDAYCPTCQRCAAVNLAELVGLDRRDEQSPD